MSVEYLDLVDYVAIAAEVTGLEVQTIVALPNLGLAESALHAPGLASATTSSMWTSSIRRRCSLSAW